MLYHSIELNNRPSKRVCNYSGVYRHIPFVFSQFYTKLYPHKVTIDKAPLTKYFPVSKST